MEEAGPAAQNKVAAAAQSVGETNPRVEVLSDVIDGATGPSFRFPAQSVVEGQVVGRAPFILNEKTVVGVIERTLGLIANIAGNVAALVDRGIECRFQEIRCLETLEEDHVGRTLKAWDDTVSEREHAVLDATKISLERIEEWE